MIALREATPADRDAILALRARCFPGDDPEKRDPRFWEWEFRGGRMFVACADQRIVAHLGFVPQTYIVRGAPLGAMLAVDAMTDPEFRGQRLFGRVAQFAGEHVPVSTAWQIRKSVLGGMMSGGWRPAGGARVLIRPFRSAAAKPPLSPDVNAMADIAREFFDGTDHLDRTPDYLRWRYFENPLWTYDVTMNENAWIATRRTKLRGWDTQAIVDIAWRRGRARDAAALLQSPAMLHAALVTPAHPAHGWLLRRGFLPGPHRFRLLVHGAVEAKWALAWGDTDHL